MNDGTIIEIDMDSIHKGKDGIMSVEVTGGMMLLDCKGHIGNGGKMIHIPEFSIGWGIEQAVCK